LRNTRRDGHVLNFTEWNVLGGASNEAGVDLQLRVSDGVANHVSSDVVVSGNQQQRQRERDRDRSRHADRCQQKDQSDAAKHRQSVTGFDKHHRWPDREDCVFEVLIVIEIERA
jgi:hypothetical protein